MTDFFTKQHLDDYRKQEILSVNTTVTVWAPSAEHTVTITGLDISKQGANDGTLRFYFVDNTWINEYALSATTTIYPRFSGLRCTTIGQALRAVSANAGWRITAYGFEIHDAD